MSILYKIIRALQEDGIAIEKFDYSAFEKDEKVPLLRLGTSAIGIINNIQFVE
jgi:hypothetical protein